ncbi:hypothetical protein Rhal01_02932 [Rubritalea halochordaticola]|uniref:GxxExxY protein n=1 Tax=Rubritalea halochordaticola TaxID=714537 RepID=A0ABP9V7Y3_9BACT
MSLIYKQESFDIIGACFEVYNELGNGFDERVYHEALLIELMEKKISFASEPSLEISYKGHKLTKQFKPDLICFDKIIIELKAVTALNDYHRQQVLNYLKATGYKLALLVNFGNREGLQYERVLR